jgi:hypothetical protein
VPRPDLRLNWIALRRAALVLLPAVIWGLFSPSNVWLQVALVTMSTFIVHETSGTAPLGVLAHAFTISGCFVGLLLSQAFPPLFVALCSLVAMGCVRIAALGTALRTLGSFTFAPALYLAVAAYEQAHDTGMREQLIRFAPALLMGVLPTFFLACWEHARDSSRKVSYWRHFSALLRPFDRGPALTSWLPPATAACAVGLSAFVAEFSHLPHAQWAIWSAASVVGADAVSTRLKWRDRTVGAVVGVPLGLVLGTLLPHHVATVSWCVIGSLLTLVAFRSYVVAFGTRSALAIAALFVAGVGPVSAVERVGNVLLGGCIGVACSLAATLLANHRLP